MHGSLYLLTFLTVFFRVPTVLLFYSGKSGPNSRPSHLFIVGKFLRCKFWSFFFVVVTWLLFPLIKSSQSFPTDFVRISFGGYSSLWGFYDRCWSGSPIFNSTAWAFLNTSRVGDPPWHHGRFVCILIFCVADYCHRLRLFIFSYGTLY